MCKLTSHEKLTLKITNGGWMNLHKWVERIVKDYITYWAIEDRTSLDTVKEKFYTDLHKVFLCIAPRLLHKFMLDKGVGNIVEYRPWIRIPLPNRNLEEKDEK